MKKNSILFVFLLCIATISFSQNCSVIEPDLQQLLDNASEEKITVTIVMNSHAELSAVRAKAAAHRDRNMKRIAVVNAFKSHSKSTQSSLLSFLQDEERAGNVSDITSLWISNSITCKATSKVLGELAKRSDVSLLGLDKEVSLLGNSHDIQQPASIERSSGLTPHVIQVNASQVWEQGYTGKNVVVAILDSGINGEHSDLKDHLWQGLADTDDDGEADDIINGWNFATLDPAGNPNIKDDYGHGTHCAGIICGDGTSGNITGVAPDATLMALKVVNRSGGGSPAQMIRGVQFAIENGASILSISSGFKANQIDNSAKESLRRAFVAALESGVIAFVAAGNDGNSYGAPDNVDFPAACPPPYLHPDQQSNAGGLSSVVCVGAVNADDEYASFSSQGPVTWQGTVWNDYLYDAENIGLIRPDICAPGDLIYSLKHDENDKYKFNSGTSQATPCAAGVAALMLDKNSMLNPADICRLMEETAKKLTLTKSNLSGSGRIDALNVINAIEPANEKPYIKVSTFAPESLTQGDGKDLCLVVVNNGKAKSNENTTIVLSVDDEYISIEKNIEKVGAMDVGENRTVTFVLDVAENTPNGHTVYVKAVTTDGLYSWNDEFVLEVNSYAQMSAELQGISRIDAGKETTVDIKIINNGTVSTTADSRLTLESNSSYVTFIKNEAVVGVLAAGEVVTVPFTFKVSDGIADNSTIRFDLYAVPNNYTDIKDFIYEFEVGTDSYGYLEDGFNGWTTFDANNDGRNHPWWHSSKSLIHRMESDGGSLSGNGHLISETYCQASMIEYSVPIDNYLVSPRIRVAADSKMRFRARVHTPFYGEHFGIAVSEKGNTLAEDFVTTNEWTIESKDGDDWIEYTIDLSAYEGKDIYVAIRHFFTQEEWAGLSNGYDLYALHVDDVEFVNVTDVSDAFRYDNYSSFSLRVNSVPLLAPANLEAKVLGRSSISLSWDAVLGAQSYSIYRNGVWVKNVSDATTYTDTGLKSNTTYTYKVAACANDKEYEHSNEVSATTAQEDYVVSIKSVSPNVLEKGENLLSIIMINDGKYEQESRSTVTLSTDNPYVAVTSGGVNINALYAGQEVTKEFYISVDESIPYGTAVEFNLNVAQKFEPYRTWDHTFVLMYGVETRVEDVESSKSSDFVIYDLCGRRVNRPIKGIYIVNGMKVIYK